MQLLRDELSRAESPSFMQDAAGVAEVIAWMCAPEQPERYASLAEVLDDLAIIEA